MLYSPLDFHLQQDCYSKVMKHKGYIFLCNDNTESECLDKNLFGGTEKYGPRVRGISTGDQVYLYNRDKSVLHGIFTATSQPNLEIDPNAWNGAFPYQIRVKRIENCKPLSRYEIAPTLLRPDRANRPTGRLTEVEVKELDALFHSTERIQRHSGERFKTDDGHYVKSEAERTIDNWLYRKRISHAYETQIGIYQCDFEIPLTSDKSVFIEYWGLSDEKYLKDKKAKIKLYQENGLELIQLSPEDKDIVKALEVSFRGRF